MAVNKNRIVAQAQRFTAKGQFEKAIAEYRRILKSDPSDIRTMLKIGDLYTRMGARKEATDTFLRVAEQYGASGFHLKAIAVYKQILNLDPTQVTIHKLLAASYLELGLTSEALIQLEQLADAYQRTNRPELLLEVLLQMGGIDPKNIATRLRIAELLSKESRIPEATKHFAMACEELRAQGRRDDFVKVAERLFYHDPSRLDIAREIAEMYIQRGRFKEALGKLQACFKRNPKDPNTLELLASTFRGLGQPDKAISVYEELFELLKELGDERKQRALLEEILALDPTNQRALARLHRSSQVPGGMFSNDAMLSEAVMEEVSHMADPDALSPGSIDLTVEISEMESENPDDESACQELMDEVQVLIKYGLKERALEHLNRVFNIDPYHIDARELARDILLDLNRPEEAIEQLFLMANAFKDTQPEGSVYYLHEILKIDSTNNEAKAMVRMLGGIMPEGLDSDIRELDEDSDDLLLLDDEEDIILVDSDDILRAEDAAGNARPSRSDSDWSDLDVDEGEDDEEIEELDDLDQSEDIDSEEMEEISVVIQPEPERPAGTSTSRVPTRLAPAPVEMADSLPPDDVLDSTPPGLDSISPAPMDSLATGPFDSFAPSPFDTIPPDVLDSEYPDDFSDAPEPSQALTVEPKPPQEIAGEPEPPEVITVESTKPPQEIAGESKPPEETAGEPGMAARADLDDELEEVAFFIEQELYDEARSMLDEITGDHPDDPRLPPLREKLAAALREEEPESEMKTVILPTAKPTDEDEKSDPTGNVRFKNVGLQEKVSAADSTTNWDLGLAYQEMGLYEDAIQAFRIASRDPAKKGQATTMIGMCYVSLDRKEEAVTTFEKGLKDDSLDERQRLGLLYELGKTLQMMGERERALDCFENIRDIDDSFADVKARISALSRLKANPASL